MVRNAGITTIVFTGISTELGVESSARDALNRDFYSVVVSDAICLPDKDAHARSLQNMERFLTVHLQSVVITTPYNNGKYFWLDVRVHLYREFNGGQQMQKQQLENLQ